MITLFSTGCPRCLVLEQKLKQQGINFKIEHDIQEIIEKGFMSAPILKVNNRYLEFGEAVKWINNYDIS